MGRRQAWVRFQTKSFTIVKVKRVFILGAGFSKSLADIPIADELFPAVYNFANAHNIVSWRSALAYLSDLIPSFDPLDLTRGNIEDYLSLIDALIFLYRQLNGKAPNEALNHKIHMVGRLSLQPPTPNLARFAGMLTADDTVISFNWDLLLENSLYTAGKLFSLCPGSGGQLKIIKLHGSIDWIDIALEPRPGYTGPVPQDKTLFEEIMADPPLIRAKTYDYPDGPLSLPIGLFVPLGKTYFIVPPSFFKEPGIAVLAKLWAEAYDAIVQADEIIIFGYSLPTADYHARAVLRAAVEAKEQANNLRLTAVDIDPGVENHLSGFLSRDITFFNMACSEYIDQHLAHSPQA